MQARPRRDSRRRRRRSAQVLRTHNHGLVLVLILASLAFQLAAPDVVWARFVIVALQGATLLTALWASRAPRPLRHLAAVAVALLLVAGILAWAGSGEFARAPSRVVGLLLVALAPAAIAAGLARDVRASGVTMRTMFGVLCIYLLLGMLFAFGYGTLTEISGTAFFAGGLDGTPADFLYFSFATLTTVGYGDLTAVTDVGRSLAITEALLGQIYMVTVVALIVGNIGRGARGAAPGRGGLAGRDA